MHWGQKERRLERRGEERRDKAKEGVKLGYACEQKGVMV